MGAAVVDPWGAWQNSQGKVSGPATPAKPGAGMTLRRGRPWERVVNGAAGPGASERPKWVYRASAAGPRERQSNRPLRRHLAATFTTSKQETQTGGPNQPAHLAEQRQQRAGDTDHHSAGSDSNSNPLMHSCATHSWHAPAISRFQECAAGAARSARSQILMPFAPMNMNFPRQGNL